MHGGRVGEVYQRLDKLPDLVVLGTRMLGEIVSSDQY